MVLCKSTAIDKQIDREITTLNNVRSYLDEKRFIYPLNSGKKNSKDSTLKEYIFNRILDVHIFRTMIFEKH